MPVSYIIQLFSGNSDDDVLNVLTIERKPCNGISLAE